MLNEFGCIADGNAWQQIKINRDAGELVEMVDGLWSNDLTCRCYSAHRNQIRAGSSCGCDSADPRSAAALVNRAAGIAPHIQIIEISRLCALVVFHFEDDLILIVRLFD